MKEKILEEFKERMMELTHISSALAVLSWDQEVYMPNNGTDLRSKTIASLAGLLHEKFISKEFQQVLEKIGVLESEKKLNRKEIAIYREVLRDFSRAKKIPSNFVRELTELCSKSQSIWAEARTKSDFKIFQPYLEKIVELKRKEAELVGYRESPYDAMLDTYEPGATSQEIAMVFNELREFLVDFLKRIKESQVELNPNILKGKFPMEKQRKFSEFVISKMGFNFNSGRLDESTHPFSISFNPLDTRITTRYKEDDLFYSLSSTIHEAGHALYEQGIDFENFGTPLGEAVSVGIHESQSRIWEKIVGQSREFWKYFYTKLRRDFPESFMNVKLDDFYKIINRVEASLIRTEADEVTYNLHIILRFEIEKDLIEGKIEVRDLPKIWNEKIKEYLGIQVTGDSFGVLQDVHWSGGSFGYFPTYTLGNLYSAQMYEAAKKDIADLEKEISLGKFEKFREWLRKNIHIHGKMYTAEKLIVRITGNPLSSKYFINYIKNKYKKIYAI